MDDKVGFKEGLRLRGSQGRSSSVLPKHYGSSKDLHKYYLPTPSSIYITVLLFLVFVYAIIVEMEKRLPEPILIEDEHNYPGRFIAQRAKNHILNLTSLGPRPTGSFENEVLAVNFFTREINSIFNKANKIHRISTDIQKVSGAFPLDFLDGMTNVYRNVQNVLVKIGPHKESPHSLLVNCHFDTVADSPGGSDDGASCAVMLEMLRVISRSDTPLTHNLIFLFNGAEENWMQASHGFVTRHRWAHEVRAFVNLEACGAGGRELLFQAGPEHPWLMEAYASSVPYPLASSIAEEVFQSGIIPGDTDFRIFRDFGHISGLDFAWSSNGYVYHTKLDNAAQIPLGTLQRTGDNILPLVLRLVAAPEMSNVSAHRAGNLVFFDFLGAFIVRWSKPIAAVVNIAVVAASVYVVRWNMMDANIKGVPRREYLRQLVFCGLVIISWWLLSLVCTAAISTILTLLNRSMSWFSRPVWILFLYIVPSLLVSLTVVLLAAKRLKKVVRSPWLQFRLFWDAHQLIFTLFLSIAIVFGIRSGFICALWVAFACVANVLTQRTLAKRWVADWRWIFIPVGVMLLPYIQNGYIINGALLLVVPIMGRSGSGNHAELVLSLIATTMFILLLTFIVPMILLVRNPKRVVSLLSAIVFVALLTLVLTPLGFPYSSDAQNPSPQRFTIIHTDRVHHDAKGAVREQKTGFWVVNMDVNSPRTVMTLVPEMAQATLIDEECKTELFCGLPYLIPVFSIVWKTHWIAGPQPVVAIPTELTMTQRELRSHDTVRLQFSVVGPDHMSLMISPRTGVRLSGWSVDPGEPLQGITFNGRPTYFIYYSYASDPEPWNFWVDFQVEGNGDNSGSIVDIGLSGHFLHGAHQRSVPLQRLLSKFPPWSVTTGWTATYKSYIF